MILPHQPAESRRQPLLDSTVKDLQFALRTFRKTPRFTAVAVLTLALGIGANTAIFSLIDTILLRPLPVVNPEQLVALSLIKTHGATLGLFSYPNYRDFRDNRRVLADLAAYRFAPMNLSRGAGNNERVWGYVVSGNYFQMLGVNASVGRTFSPEEDRTPGADPVVVLSYACYERRFESDPGIIGQTITLNGRQFTVIGVAPRGFTGTERIFMPEMWVPSMMQSWIDPGAVGLEERGSAQWFTVGRLKSGFTESEAKAALDVLAVHLGQEYPETNDGLTVQLSPPGLVIPAARTPAFGLAGILMLTVGLVLLIACANLGGLLLARVADRRKEIAIRLALGATRWRLIKQLLIESLLLAIAGGVLGLLLASLILDLVVILRPPLELGLTVDFEIDTRVLTFSLVISLLTGLLFGLMPALQASKTDLVSGLKNEPSPAGYRRSDLRNGMIVVQVALSFLLLIAAGLIVRSLQRVQLTGPGFETENRVVFSVNPSLQGYDEARAQEFYRRLLGRVESIPGVEAVSVTTFLPLSLHYLGVQIHLEGDASSTAADIQEGMQGSVGLNYFATMAIPLLAGRDFSPLDRKNTSPVAIVNETFARRFWPNQSAVGKRFATERGSTAVIEIIGIAKDGKYFSITEDARPFVYRPLAQGYIGDGSNDGTVIMRTVGEPGGIMTAVRREVERLDPTLPVFDVKTLKEHLRLPLFPLRVGATIVGCFGLLAVTLAGIGLYGVMACAVSRRTREIGIRIALGAVGRDVVNLILSQGIKLIVPGLVIGFAGSLAVGRLLQRYLPGVEATDSLTFILMGFLLIGITFLACYIPARRATRVEPIVALRGE